MRCKPVDVSACIDSPDFGLFYFGNIIGRAIKPALTGIDVSAAFFKFADRGLPPAYTSHCSLFCTASAGTTTGRTRTSSHLLQHSRCCVTRTRRTHRWTLLSLTLRKSMQSTFTCRSASSLRLIIVPIARAARNATRRRPCSSRQCFTLLGLASGRCHNSSRSACSNGGTCTLGGRSNFGIARICHLFPGLSPSS